jgi:hypothetical protein
MVEQTSSASSSETSQLIFGSWAVGLRKASTTPRARLVRPSCSERSVCLRSLILRAAL